MALIPAAADADASSVGGRWYRAPGWRAAARQMKAYQRSFFMTVGMRHRLGRPLRIAVAIALGATVAACEPGSDLPPIPPPASQGYQLAPGDEVRVITYGETTLTGSFRVDDGGAINLPLLGPVHAAGFTTQQLAANVTAELSQRKLLNDPSVTIESTMRRPIFVLGEVQRPGRYIFEPGMTVLSAVAVAGGFTPRAAKRQAEIVRETGEGPVHGRADAEAEVAPGDVINILERHF